MFMVGLLVDCKDYYVRFMTKNKQKLVLRKVKLYNMGLTALSSAKQKNHQSHQSRRTFLHLFALICKMESL